MNNGRQDQKTFMRYMMDGFMDHDVITGVEGCFRRALLFCVSSVSDMLDRKKNYSEA